MKKSILATAIALSVAAAADAQAGNFYLFAEAGHNDIEAEEAASSIAEAQQQDRESVDQANASLGANLQYSDSADSDTKNAKGGLGVGYRFTDRYAMELAYRDLGEGEYTGDGEITGGVGNGSREFRSAYESEAVILRGVARHHFTEAFAVEALLGVAYVDTSYVRDDTFEGSGIFSDSATYESEDESGFSATYGIGASYAMTDTLTGYARWERIHDIDTDDQWDGIEADTVSLGLRYHF